MAKFIEVTYGGQKLMINAETVEEVGKDYKGRAVIYLAFNEKGETEHDSLTVQERYEQVRQMLMGGTEDGK